MTDKEKIIKELKEALDNLDITNKYRLNLIRAIEYLQEEPISEDLEEAATKYIKGNYSPWLYKVMFDCFKAGAQWQKEQMMAKAIDAHCFGFQGAALFTFRLPAGSYLVGSKVKVIVIKDE